MPDFIRITLAAGLLAFLIPGCGGSGAVGLVVGDIEGPESVNEGTTVQLAISATGDAGITFHSLPVRSTSDTQ